MSHHHQKKKSGSLKGRGKTKKQYICYTGIGSNKTGTHTAKDFLKRMEKNPDRVMSVGDDVVGPWYDKVIAHRKKWGKTIPDRKSSFFQSRRVPYKP